MADEQQKALQQTQDPNTLMYLKQIGNALPNAPAGATEALVEGAPAAAVTALGGVEPGVLSTLFHKVPVFLTGGRIKQFLDAYSSTIEDAVRNPVAAKKLANAVANRPRGQTGPQALGQAVLTDFKRATLNAPLATRAGALSTPQ